MSIGDVRHTAELKHYPFLKRHIIKEHTDFQALVPASTRFCPISVQKVGAKNHSRWLRKRLYGLYVIPPIISLVKKKMREIFLYSNDLTPNLMYR